MKKFLLLLLSSAAVAAVSADEFADYFEVRNRMANFVLAAPSPGEEGALDLRLPDATAHMRCPFCEGRRECVLEEPNYGQLDGRIGGAKKKKLRCPLCKGAGGWKAFEDPARRSADIARGLAEFSASHQSKGDLAEGGAFIPRDFADADRKTLRRVQEAFGKPCSQCKWSGIVQCRKCGGKGVVRCGAKDCKGGWLVTKTTTTQSHSGGGIRGGNSSFHSVGSRSHRTTKRETVTVVLCPDCGGAALRRCEECDGERAKICPRCSGTGVKQKQN